MWVEGGARGEGLPATLGFYKRSRRMQVGKGAGKGLGAARCDGGVLGMRNILLWSDSERPPGVLLTWIPLAEGRQQAEGPQKLGY